MSKFSDMISVMTDEIHKYSRKCVESASFDRTQSARIINILEKNKYDVKLSDGTEKSVLSLTSDSFSVNDVVIVLISQNDIINSYILGKPGVSKTSPSGYGNMFKEVYDVNDNGVVDNAEKVDGHTVLTDVPTGAVFTDTTYSDATTSVHGLMSSTDKTKLDGVESGAEKNISPDWNATSGDSKILNKPSTFSPSAHTHTKSDITDFPTIPDQLSDLSDDSTHRLVTDTEKSTWNGKQNATDILTAETSLSDSDEFPFYDVSVAANRKTLLSSIKTVLKTYFDGLYAAISHTHTKSQITDFPTIPDQLSDLADDSTHRVVTDTEISTWNSKQSALSGDVTTHYHSSDRNRANHSGTQTASTISDFASAVLSDAPAETVTSVGAIVNGATAKTSPVDADMIPLMDSAASNVIKKLSWSYVKSVLHTYFSSIFAAISHTHTASSITDLSATATEINYSHGVTSGIQAQLNGKQPTLTFDSTPTASSGNPVTSGGVYTAMSSKAPLASPALSGTPTAPTASAGTNTTQLATTAFVHTAVSSSSSGTTIIVSSTQPASQAVNDLWFQVIS